MLPSLSSFVQSIINKPNEKNNKELTTHIFSPLISVLFSFLLIELKQVKEGRRV